MLTLNLFERSSQPKVSCLISEQLLNCLKYSVAISVNAFCECGIVKNFDLSGLKFYEYFMFTIWPGARHGLKETTPSIAICEFEVKYLNPT